MKRTKVRSWTLVAAGSLIIGGMLTGCGGGSSSASTPQATTNPSGSTTASTGTGTSIGTDASTGTTAGTSPSTGTGAAGGTSQPGGTPPTATITPVAKPSIQGSAPTTVSAGQAYDFQPQASGGSGALSFTVANKPAWATFNASTGQLSGTPAATDVGTTANVEISVTDGTSVVSLPAFSITVMASAASTPATAGTVTLAWQAPTANTDGSTLTDLAGYDIYYGTKSQSYTSTIQVSNPGLTNYVVQNLPAGTYYFVVSAYDSSGAQSAYSPEVSATVN